MTNRFLGALGAAVWLMSLAGVGFAQEPDTSMWVANGPVHSVTAAGGTVYIGGSFTHVGPPTGGFVRIDATTGAVLPPIHRVAGAVTTVAPDGGGG